MSLDLSALLDTLRHSDAMRAKQAIQRPAQSLAPAPADKDGEARYALPGDDTAALRCGDQYLLLAIEGMLPQFVAQAPWFAGWSAVMANVSDITAMGGRAAAVVNAYWHHDTAAADQLLAGIRAACQAYGVHLVGGHTSQGPEHPTALAVAITGWARCLLSTLHVRPGQCLAMVADLDGRWHGDAPYWKAFEDVAPSRLRAKLEVIPQLAEAGLLQAAKDISNAGLLGTLLMLLEPTGSGAQLDLTQVPRPAEAPLERWLRAFPSYGFLLTLDDRDLAAVTTAFAREGLQCAAIGRIDASARLSVELDGQRAEFWNLHDHSFTGFSQAEEF
ncbi:sll0787 family AIR synthase-like protein [Pseudomonas oryzihabitans]|uniref:sll0787 family AIR synthase-like protein n=1 Tax=Pseudomonas oryzihabitans TaxID=47885 RepID=UPI001123563F|nr:sll0787 family AIR synthase-like protein [Pseudomonas psychrotolerans]QDD87543.1 AIR synthase [Pseudomonas psychrotolerans]